MRPGPVSPVGPGRLDICYSLTGINRPFYLPVKNAISPRRRGVSSRLLSWLVPCEVLLTPARPGLPPVILRPGLFVDDTAGVRATVVTLVPAWLGTSAAHLLLGRPRPSVELLALGLVPYVHVLHEPCPLVPPADAGAASPLAETFYPPTGRPVFPASIVQPPSTALAARQTVGREVTRRVPRPPTGLGRPRRPGDPVPPRPPPRVPAVEGLDVPAVEGLLPLGGPQAHGASSRVLVTDDAPTSGGVPPLTGVYMGEGGGHAVVEKLKPPVAVAQGHVARRDQVVVGRPPQV